MLQKVICQRADLLRPQVFNGGHGDGSITLRQRLQPRVVGACRGGMLEVALQFLLLSVLRQVLQRRSGRRAPLVNAMTRAASPLAVNLCGRRRRVKTRPHDNPCQQQSQH